MEADGIKMNALEFAAKQKDESIKALQANSEIFSNGMTSVARDAATLTTQLIENTSRGTIETMCTLVTEQINISSHRLQTSLASTMDE